MVTRRGGAVVEIDTAGKEQLEESLGEADDTSDRRRIRRRIEMGRPG